MSEGHEICGIVPVYKPKGWTSFDVIAKLRGILHIKRLGHAGTLDPMATGVLPVFVGKATKACDILPDSDKAYEAGFRLGISTDTQDITGKTLTQSEAPVTREELDEALGAFRGSILQTPPMYSAVKVGGQRLYELARQGREVQREAREITVYELHLQDYDEHTREGRLYVSCSKGTYIRTLIHDLGAALGCGGAMTSLCRVRAAGFELADCLTMEQLAEIPTVDAVMPLDRAFADFESVRLSERCTPLFKNGVKLRAEQVGISREQSESFRVYGSGGEFLAVAVLDREKNEVRSVRNFY